MVYLAKADHVDLKEQLNLQLGAKGSHTVINYGARPWIRLGSTDEVHYMDIVDIDQYDAVLGTTFCMAHNVVLDMKQCKVWVDGREVPTVNPYGANDEVDRAVQNLLIDEEIRQSLDPPDERLKELRVKWMTEYDDILWPPLLELLPMREVNHSIPLIDPELKIKYHLP
ncbi:hypothetical protein C8Q72DRAFT_889805 [Fomitopsis betulina]|nr:hypothetical protein C8Q72DRAFT_889805 [Fomitopsis betulina]